MPRINRRARRRRDPDVLPEDITDDLYDLEKYTTEQLERWFTDYPQADGLTRLFVHRVLRHRGSKLA